MKTKPLQVAISVLLLVGFFYFIDLHEIFSVISDSNKWSFFLACIFSLCGNVACAFRWTKLLNFESKMKFWEAIKVYFESISFTTVVPVGMLGSDYYRSIRLSSRKPSGKFTSKLKASKEVVLSVVADRVHGFWALCLLALITIFYSLVINNSTLPVDKLHLNQNTFVGFYSLFLFFVVVVPFLSSKIKLLFSKSTIKLSTVIQLMTRGKKRITIFASVLSQAFFAISFFLCLSATNVDISIYQCLIIVPIIFLFAAMPFSLAGFGPREYGAAIVLSFLGYSLENSVASSILFGLTTTVQGIGFLLINLIFSYKDR
ncbi:flippase-like domain-containing protein [Betaproteobacteria bacterium]|nr:flippase-like domain-containing protein [Betaproteobacteria bacterium]